MFKRIDRRRERKEKEERLGLDEDQLGVFGLHHTDSSESESDSSDSASTPSSVGIVAQSRKKRKREASSSCNEGGENKDDKLAADEDEDEGNIHHGSHPPLTIASALKEPIRPHSDSEAWVCAFCPGKTLKHAAMVKVHEASRVRIDYNHSVDNCTQERFIDTPAAFQAHARARDEIQSGRRHRNRTCNIYDIHTTRNR